MGQWLLAKYLLLDSKDVILDFASFGILEIDWNIHQMYITLVSGNSVCDIDRNKVCFDLMFLSTSLLGIYK